MRLLYLLVLAFATAARAVTFPDAPDAAFDDVRRLESEALSALSFAALMDSTGQKAKGAEHIERFHEKLSAELAARLAHAADLSLTAVYSWCPVAERKAAQAALEALVPHLHELSRLHVSFAAQLASAQQTQGATPSAELANRAVAYQLLRNLDAPLATLRLADVARDRRSAAAAELRRLALGEHPLEAAIAAARALPAADGRLATLAATVIGVKVLPLLSEATADSLALDAVCTRLVEADPASVAFWLARSQVRLARGWRRGAAADFLVAFALDRAAPDVAEQRELLLKTPFEPASVWQEFASTEALLRVSAARTAERLAGPSPAALAAPLERAARAFTRNRARRLYVCSGIADPAERAAALQWVAARHGARATIVPALAPEIGASFGPAAQAASEDATALLAVHHRYAPLFAGTEAFWRLHAALFLRAEHAVGSAAALDVAAVVNPEAGWLAEARRQLEVLRKASAAK